MQLELGLTLALISAVAVNWAYSREHDAAAVMPRFSARRPLRFVSLLLGDKRWITAFAAETAGWLVYVAALRLAPISLVQAVCASGIAVLALASGHGHPGALARHEQLAVVAALAGLALLGLSLVDTHQADHPPHWGVVLLWLGGSSGAAAGLALLGAGLARGPALGLAAGLLFAGGDISAKLVVYGGAWIFAALTLIACYALGTSVLQGSFQHGNALTGAGLATLTTNAVPIAAGFIVFGEHLPAGVKGTLQLAAFAALVGSAALLARGLPSRPGEEAHSTRATAAGKARVPPRWFVTSFWRAHRRLVRASGGRRGLWHPRPGKWGPPAADNHWAAKRRAAKRHSRLLRGRGQPGVHGDERLGFGRAGLVAQPAGESAGDRRIGGRNPTRGRRKGGSRRRA